MNSVSILIYLAGVLPSVSLLILWLGALFTISLVIFSFIVFIIWATENEFKDAEDRDPLTKFLPRKRWFALAVFALILGNLIPNERTMIMIAASEVGEVVVTDPRVTQLLDKSVQVLNHKLDQYLEEDRKAEEKAN